MDEQVITGTTAAEIAASVRALHGATTMPMVMNEPLEIGAA